MEKDIKMIVLTGGPCAGKTSILPDIYNDFKSHDVGVLVVPETTTDMIKNGICPWDMDVLSFQTLQMQRQIESEKLFLSAAERLPQDRVIIICDRGCMDASIYTPDDIWDKVLQNNNVSGEWARDHYDAVIKLDTLAKEENNGIEMYNKKRENNSARTETADEAIACDDKVERAWVGTSHFVSVKSGPTWESKRKNAIKAANDAVGIPVAKEIERKFLIEMPNLDELINRPDCQKTEILQTYLKEDDNTEVRVRQRGTNGNYTYFETKKSDIKDGERYENDRIISKEEYLEKLMLADSSKHSIRKDRYCVLEGKQYTEIDIYDGVNDRAIMEIECDDLDDDIVIPKEITIIKEVTGDKKYSNKCLAENMDILFGSKKDRPLPDEIVDENFETRELEIK